MSIMTLINLFLSFDLSFELKMNFLRDSGFLIAVCLYCVLIVFLFSFRIITAYLPYGEYTYYSEFLKLSVYFVFLSHLDRYSLWISVESFLISY